MGLPRSTYYDAPPVKTDDASIVTIITAICDEFEAYGYRRKSRLWAVRAEGATRRYTHSQMLKGAFSPSC